MGAITQSGCRHAPPAGVYKIGLRQNLNRASSLSAWPVARYALPVPAWARTCPSASAAGMFKFAPLRVREAVCPVSVAAGAPQAPGSGSAGPGGGAEL
eukprot:382816-Rhodomonas_salina.1